MLNGVARHRRHLDGCAALLASLSYHGVLQRGFALVRDGAGQSVRSVAQVAVGQRLDIEFADGHVAAQAMEAGAAQPREDGACVAISLAGAQQAAKGAEATRARCFEGRGILSFGPLRGTS